MNLYHLLYQDLWENTWSNIFAPSVFSLFAIILSHIKRTRQADRHHAEMKAHITGAVVSTAWMKPEKPGPPT